MSKKTEQPILRPDFLYESKEIRVSVQKSTYVEFQKKLIDLGITQKRAIGEFARMIVANDPTAMKFLNEIVKKIFKRELDKLHRIKNDRIDKLDQDVLYHLIEDSQNDKKTDADTGDD